MTVTDTPTTDRTEQGTNASVTGTTPGIARPTLGRRELSDAARVAASYLPDRKRLLYYGALGVLAAVEVVEWPVAVAIGVGTEVARRTAGPATGAGLAASRPLTQPPAQGPVETAGAGADVTPADESTGTVQGHGAAQ